MGKRARALLRERMARLEELRLLKQEQRRRRARLTKWAGFSGLITLTANVSLLVITSNSPTTAPTGASMVFLGLLASLFLLLVAFSAWIIDDDAMGPALVWKPVLFSLFLTPLGLAMSLVVIAQWARAGGGAAGVPYLAAALITEGVLMGVAVAAFRLFTQMERRHREEAYGQLSRANG